MTRLISPSKKKTSFCSFLSFPSCLSPSPFLWRATHSPCVNTFPLKTDLPI